MSVERWAGELVSGRAARGARTTESTAQFLALVSGGHGGARRAAYEHIDRYTHVPSMYLQGRIWKCERVYTCAYEYMGNDREFWRVVVFEGQGSIFYGTAI